MRLVDVDELKSLFFSMNASTPINIDTVFTVINSAKIVDAQVMQIGANDKLIVSVDMQEFERVQLQTLFDNVKKVFPNNEVIVKSKNVDVNTEVDIFE